MQLWVDRGILSAQEAPPDFSGSWVGVSTICDVVHASLLLTSQHTEAQAPYRVYVLRFSTEHPHPGSSKT